MMKPTFRALVMPGILLLACIATASAQLNSPNIKKRPQPTVPTAPVVSPPAGGGVTVNPVVKPPPGIPKPGIPPVTPKPTPYPPVKPPGVVPGYPVIVTPVYPSAWVGPTIIRETRSEPAPAPTSNGTSTAAVPSVQVPVLRLVAVLGELKRLHPATGVDLGLAEAPLGVAVGMLAGYAQDKPVRAAGDFFGTPWDGPGCFATREEWKSGPFLNHPLMTVNELSPGPWEFEAGFAGRSVGWVRLAVSLFEETPQTAPAKPVNLPRGRRAAMREVLHRVTWADKGVAVGGQFTGMPEAAASAGSDVTHFGKALATFAEKTMTPSPDNERLGIAEWFFSPQELSKVLAACPRFMPETPDGAMLREVRAAAGPTAPWTRKFEVRHQTARYTGEIWLVIVADGAINTWLRKP